MQRQMWQRLLPWRKRPSRKQIRNQPPKQDRKRLREKPNNMTHTVHPYSHRLGIIRDWKSRWFGTKQTYKKFLKSDVLIRQFLEKKLRGFFVADILMERS